MREYRSFLVETLPDPYGFSDLRAHLAQDKGNRSHGSIYIASLPPILRSALAGPPALFRIKRVRKGTYGACKVKVIPSQIGSSFLIATYGCLYGRRYGMICRKLANLVGYAAKRPQAIFVTITKVKELIDAHS
jgi:hypothetical protein